MILRKKLLYLCAYSIAVFCDASDIDNEIWEDSTSEQEIFETEQKMTSLLEETLSHLKERKEKIGMPI